MGVEGAVEMAIASILEGSWPSRARGWCQALADEDGPKLVVEAEDGSLLNLGAGAGCSGSFVTAGADASPGSGNPHHFLLTPREVMGHGFRMLF